MNPYLIIEFSERTIDVIQIVSNDIIISPIIITTPIFVCNKAAKFVYLSGGVWYEIFLQQHRLYKYSNLALTPPQNKHTTTTIIIIVIIIIVIIIIVTIKKFLPLLPTSTCCSESRFPDVVPSTRSSIVYESRSGMKTFSISKDLGCLRSIGQVWNW